jgi:hypothetical protein
MLGLALAIEADGAAPARRAALLGDAAVALEDSLSRAPANPYVWTRLALVRQSLGADDAELLRYLRLSWQTGPNEERLRLSRIRLALQHWTMLQGQDRPSLFTDIRYAWRDNPDDLISVARSDFIRNVIRAALLPDLPALTAFEAALQSSGQH